MKTFHFSLQALRILRERQEQIVLQDYGRALQLWEQARDKVDAILQQIQIACLEAQQKLIEGCSGSDLMQLQSYCQSLEQRRRQGEQAARVARHQASLAFTRLIAARQARAVVDKCFDQQKRRHDHDRQRREQGILDDMLNHRDLLAQLFQAGPETQWN
jgi:flagellar export protein FliJ